MKSRAARFDERARRSAWLVWLAGVGVYFLAFLHRASLGVAGPDAVDRLDISATELGAFIMVQLGIYALMQVPAGMLLDRWGPRRVLLVATLIMGTAQILFAVATTYPVAVLARALLGVGDAAVFIAVLRLAAVWFPHGRYPILTMLTGLAGMAGNLAATVPLVIALDGLGWTTTFVITGGTSLVYALLLLRPAVAAPYREDTPTPSTAPTRRSRRRRRGRGWAQVRAAWARPETRLAFWAHQATMSPGLVISLVWGYPYLTEALGYSNEAAASQLSGYVVATLVASLIVGPLAGRRPAWRTPMAVLIAVSGVSAIAALVLWPGGQPPGLVVTIAFTVVAAGGPASQIGFHLARDYNPAARLSTATGLVNIGGFGGAMVVAIAVGFVLDLASAGATATVSDYRWAIGAIAVLISLSILGLLISLLRVRTIVLDRMSSGDRVVVRLTERWWDRLYRRLTRR